MPKIDFGVSQRSYVEEPANRTHWGPMLTPAHHILEVCPSCLMPASWGSALCVLGLPGRWWASVYLSHSDTYGQRGLEPQVSASIPVRGLPWVSLPGCGSQEAIRSSVQGWKAWDTHRRSWPSVCPIHPVHLSLLGFPSLPVLAQGMCCPHDDALQPQGQFGSAVRSLVGWNLNTEPAAVSALKTQGQHFLPTGGS